MAGGTNSSSYINAQTGTSYAFTAQDAGKLVIFNNAAAVAVTLQQAGANGIFTNGDYIDVLNLGGGQVTITPTTSTINGAATLVLQQGESGRIVSDALGSGTGNYQVTGTAAGSAGGSGIITAPVTDPVDFLTVTPAATANPATVSLAATGSDANIHFLLNSKGTGVVAIGGTTVANSAVQVVRTASAVNFLQATGAIATASPQLLATGTDTNVGLLISTKGTGAVNIGGTTAANSSLQIATVASAVNQVVLTPAATGTAPSLQTGGSGADANRNLSLLGAGTGIVTLGTVGTITGSTPQTLNGQRGVVTTGTLTTAAATAATYVINNSSVTAASIVHVQLLSYSGTWVTNGYPIIGQAAVGSTTITLTIVNTHASNALNGTLQIAFTVTN